MPVTDGWPLMIQAQPSITASSGNVDMAGSLADYHASVQIGNLGGSHFGGVAPVLRASSASTGSIMVTSGAPLMMSAFLHPVRVPDFHSGCLTLRNGGGIYEQFASVSERYIGDQYISHANTNSSGLIYFATATNSQIVSPKETSEVPLHELPLIDATSSLVIDLSGRMSSDISSAAIREDVPPSTGTVTGNNAYFKLRGFTDSVAADTQIIHANTAPKPNLIVLGGNSISGGVATPPAGPAQFGQFAIDSATGATAMVANVRNGDAARAVTLAGGTLVLTTDAPAPSAMAAAAGPLVLDSTSVVAGAKSLTVGQTVSGTPLPPSMITTGTLDLNGASTSIAGGNTFSGGVTLNAGAGTIHTASVSPVPGAVVVTGGLSIPATPREQNTFAGVISGSGAITKTGAGKLLLAGANAYTGTTTINAGTLSVSNGAAIASGDLMVRSAQGVPTQMQRTAGGTLTFGGATSTTAVPAAAPTPTFNSTANGPAVQGNSAVRAFMAANAAITSDASPAPIPWALVSNPQPDTRYFAEGDVAGYATKDMGLRQEAATLHKDNVSRESYTHIIENELKDVAREPLSTLSIDVDTASYANVRRFLNQGMIPPPDAVRIEELVNYFPTSEEGPAHEAKEPFGVRIELAPCPWQPVHRLARIAIKGRERDKDRKPSNLVFLVDVSGSMNEPAKLPLVQQSLRMLTEQLGEGDRVTMVVYAGSSGVVLPPTNGEKKGEILAAIDRLSAGGSTHGSAGIKLAYEQAVAGFIKGGVNRVILCTDGDFNVGVSSPEELEKLIKHKAKTGVFLSVLGFGSGNLQDRTMETLADKGNGNYAYIDSLSEARKVLVEQMGGTLDTIAKDVKIQVEFNPAAVRSYRLIGYENRLLAKEDFNDDTKDAGEIGAGHSVVALYEIVPANLPPGTEPRPAVDSLKYQAPAISPVQLVEAAKSGEMMTVKLRYKAPDSDLSKLIEVPTKDAGKTLTASSDEFKFSAAVASFGLLLRDSSYKGTLSWETVRRLALDGKGADRLGYRGEFLQLIDKARGLKEIRQ